jgi:hypothetical protein
MRQLPSTSSWIPSPVAPMLATLCGLLLSLVACRGSDGGPKGAASSSASTKGSAAGAGSDVGEGAGSSASVGAGGAGTGDHADHEHDEEEEADLAATASEVERVSTEHVVELAHTSVRKMEELSKRAAEAAGDCRRLAASLEAFHRDNATFIAEMNGLEEQMTKLQRRIADEQFTAPMQKAMSALLEQLVSCKDDAAVAKAFLQLQR